MFDPVKDTTAIEGCISELSARNNKPSGYPFSKITVYSVDSTMPIAGFFPKYTHLAGSNIDCMKKLDFKKAGKVFGDKIQEMKKDLSSVPAEYIIASDIFPIFDEKTRKTTGCKKYLIEVECEEQDEKWLVIQFRKALKKYITEDMNIPLAGAPFTDNYPKSNPKWVLFVYVKLGECSEKLYQALELYGKKEFAKYPIRLQMPTREYIYNQVINLNNPDFFQYDHFMEVDNEKVYFDISY